MRKPLGKLLALFALLTLCGSLVSPMVARAEDAPPAGVRGEILASMMDAGGKLQELAGAFSDGKYTWKPAKDVRSTGQVFLHVVAANYMLPSLMGVKAPMGMDELMKLDSQTMEPAKVRQMLKDSYAFAAKVITDTPDSDLETQFEFFGQKMSKRAILLVMAVHAHEHLGQAIAYARSNNVTPPWTAREQAAAKKAEAKK